MEEAETGLRDSTSLDERASPYMVRGGNRNCRSFLSTFIDGPAPISIFSIRKRDDVFLHPHRHHHRPMFGLGVQQQRCGVIFRTSAQSVCSPRDDQETERKRAGEMHGGRQRGSHRERGERERKLIKAEKRETEGENQRHSKEGRPRERRES